MVFLLQTINVPKYCTQLYMKKQQPQFLIIYRPYY
jgi:hypothetical protein